MKNYSLLILVLLFFTGCSVARTTGDVLYNTGKFTWGAAKVTGKVVKTTADVAWKTSEVTSKGVRSVVYMARGKQIVPLIREGNSLYADIKLNRKRRVRFLVDTGASSMQISRKMASALGIVLTSRNQTTVRLAGGFTVEAYEVVLKEVQIGGARVKNVPAIVLAEDNMDLNDGLIGMSFLNNFDFSINPQRPELILQQKAI